MCNRGTSPEAFSRCRRWLVGFLALAFASLAGVLLRSSDGDRDTYSAAHGRDSTPADRGSEPLENSRDPRPQPPELVATSMTNLAERSAVHPNANKPQTKTRVEALRILRECSACFTDDDRKRFLKRWLSWRQGPGPPSLRPPDFTHESLNPEGKELTDFHQADLAANIEGHNSLLREKSDQCSDLIKAALEDYFDSERGFIYSQDEEPPPHTLRSDGWALYIEQHDIHRWMDRRHPLYHRRLPSCGVLYL